MSQTPQLPMSPPEEPEEVKTTTAGRQREEAIRTGVLTALGRPVGLFRVAVRPLWGNNYRVNVLTGDDTTAVVIPNSYFVTADERGAILRSEPPIQKQYGLPSDEPLALRAPSPRVSRKGTITATNEPTACLTSDVLPDEQGPGLPRLVLEARVRLGAGATPEEVTDDVRAQGFPEVTVEGVRQLWDEGHLPVG